MATDFLGQNQSGGALFKFLGRKQKQQGVVGVELSDDGLALAYVEVTAEANTVQQCEFIPLAQGESAPERLRDRVAELGLQGSPCQLVLTAGSYSLLLVEAPKVEADELVEALRWRIKDLVPFSVEQAALDVFLLPEDSSRGGNPMAYVVAIEKSVIQTMVELVAEAKLELQAIDIAELALRNLLRHCTDTPRGIALVRLSQGGGNLSLLREGNIYLSRAFDIAYNGGLLDDLPEDALILELQRSLDYFERQMRQAPPAHIFFCGENVSADKLTDKIKHSLPGEVNILPVADALTFREGLDEHILPLCLAALGSCLRNLLPIARSSEAVEAQG